MEKEKSKKSQPIFEPIKYSCEFYSTAARFIFIEIACNTKLRHITAMAIPTHVYKTGLMSGEYSSGAYIPFACNFTE